MTIFKRIGLFMLVNIAIITVASIIMNILGVNQYITPYGINHTSLLIMCLVWGMVASFISLMMSKFMAKTIYGVKILSPEGNNGYLVKKVHDMARQAGLNKMPEVGIYESADLNAFATGPSRNNSLVAVSSGLLNNMNETELDGVLAHEVGHIANGDMVTMTLIQGVVNAFVMYLARVAAWGLDQAMRDDEGRGGLGYFGHFIAVIILQILFGIVGSIVVAYFSRAREFRADKSSADLVGPHKMIAALEALRRNYHLMDQVNDKREAIASMQISSKSKFIALLSTHPDLDQRIAALKN